ncbi:hypothetical protein OE88DRAFT_1654966, partial [Heliocybe sulcata]
KSRVETKASAVLLNDDLAKPSLCVPLRLRGLASCYVKKASRPRDSSHKPFQERGSGTGGQKLSG